MRKKQAPDQEGNESEALQERESWLQLIMENTSDSINVAEYDPLTDKRRLVICNDRFVEMSGRSREELMAAENLNELVRWAVDRGPSFREQTLKGLPSEGTSSWIRPDGKENCYEWTAVPLKAGDKYQIIGIDRDVTDRRRAEEALRESEYDLRMRVRELNCLYNITEVVNRCNNSLDDLLQGIVNVLPQACQRPETACARIKVSGKEYRTGNFRKSQTKLAADIMVAGEKVGVVEVFCLKANSPVDKKPFLKEEKYLIDTIAARIGRNIERIQTRRQLLAEQSALEHKNVALREIMTGVQDEKKEFGRRIVGNVEKIIMPLLHTLEQELPQGQRKYLDLLKETIMDITLPFADSLSKEFTSLTLTEIRICNLIRKDMSTKQIADLYHVSPATVNKHREHIRRKLRITNRDVNLATYLENYMSDHAEK